MVLDLFRDAPRADPYPVYAAVRGAQPVHRNPPGVWMLLRHADARAMLRDAETFSSHTSHTLAPDAAEHLARWEHEGAPAAGPDGATVLFADPPRHTALRSLVDAAFTPRRVRAMTAAVQQTVDDALDRVLARGDGRMEVRAELAQQVPVATMCTMVGAPLADRARLLAWTDATDTDLDLTRKDAAVTARAARAGAQLQAYVEGLVEDRAAGAERDDVLGGLLAAGLPRDQVVGTTMLLLSAGHSTTVNLVCNGLLALLRHPDQLALLRDGEVDAHRAMDELLRYDSPVQMDRRLVTRDVEIGGQLLRAGSVVFAVLGAANRDPDAFADPDRLDLARPATGHLALGAGVHFCLGAQLARMQASVTLTSLLRRLPGLALDGEPVWRDTAVMRAVTALAVTFDPTAA